MIKDTSSSTDMKYLSQDSIDYWSNLRSALENFKDEMKVSDEEIGEGIGVSRQVINQFMRWKGVESEKSKARATLPIYRDNLISLWEYITSEEQICKVKTEGAKKKRRELRAQTPNNLLEISGFLGINHQSVMGADLSKSEKFDRIIYRLSNKSLTSRDIWKIEEMVINQLAQLESNNQDEDKKRDSKKIVEIDRIERAKKWLEERYGNIDLPWRGVKSTLQKYQDLGRKDFKNSEILELFQNVAENQRLREDDFKNIRVIHCGIKTINSVHERLSELKHYKNPIKILDDILEEGILTERKLRGIKDREQEGNLNFNFMSEVKLTCRLGNDEKEITWFYRSCSSTIDNIISAIQKGIGHNLELKDLSSHVLAEGSDSIVRVSAILKNNEGSYYTGRWVDIDTILSFAQAIIMAAENWAKEKIDTSTEREIYNKNCHNFAEILNEIDVLMEKTYEYGLSYLSKNNNYDSKNALNEVKDKDEDNTIHEFEKQKGKIKEMLRILSKHQSKIYSHHIGILKETKRQVQLAESRFYHVIGNVEKAGIVIKDIEKERKEDSTEMSFNATNILLESARMTQKFYTSESDFFYNKRWERELEGIEKDIENYLNYSRGVNFLTDSLYRALAELYGNVGRFEFYNCETYNEHIPGLKTALKLSKRAVYFAMKTDDEKRASHWLARCGRILCRLNENQDADEYLTASEKILVRSATLQNQYKERTDALMLEVNIARGEQCLLNGEKERSIGYFVDAFLGAIYLRFARIMAGSLYGIYRASQPDEIDSQSKEIDIYQLFKKFNNNPTEIGITEDKRKNNERREKIMKNYERLKIEKDNAKERLEKEKEIEDAKKTDGQVDKYQRNYDNATLFYESIEILKDAVDSNEKSDNEQLSKKFQSQAIAIWNSWVPKSPNGKISEHYIARHMGRNTFLGIIK